MKKWINIQVVEVFYSLEGLVLGNTCEVPIRLRLVREYEANLLRTKQLQAKMSKQSESSKKMYYFENTINLSNTSLFYSLKVPLKLIISRRTEFSPYLILWLIWQSGGFLPRGFL